MEREPILLKGTDEMIPRQAYRKPFKVQLLNKQEWQNGINPCNKGGLAWYTEGSKTNKGIGATVYKLGLKKWHSLSLAPNHDIPG
jgi:hypothetical protein